MKKLFNAYTDKKLLLKSFKNKSGIYCWINEITQEKYIGSSINLSIRFKDYYKHKKLKVATLKNTSKIYSSILKYGYENFNVEILEFCNKEQLINREQYYLDLINPEYNILKIAGSRFGHSLSNELIKEFHSINSAARYLNTSATRLRRIAKGGNSYDNYIYKFI